MRTGQRALLIRMLIPALASSLAGCFDHSTLVAKGLVYRSNSKVDDAAVTAMLNARFPPGSSFQDLRDFAKSLGGRCAQNAQATWCDIPISGVICAENGIGISVATMPDGSVKHIEARPNSNTC